MYIEISLIFVRSFIHSFSDYLLASMRQVVYLVSQTGNAFVENVVVGKSDRNQQEMKTMTNRDECYERC